jgi:DNA-binding transcriptional ArsR family regulator
MSYLAIIDPRIFDDPTCKRAEYKVLWALGHRAQWRDPQWRGWCWPSLATIAADTGFSAPTVIKSLKRLEAGGYIKVVRTRKEDGSQAPNRYYVIHDDPRAHIAQPERLPEFQGGSQESFSTGGVVKEMPVGEVVKNGQGGSKAAHGEAVDRGCKAPHGEGVSYNTNEGEVLEHEVSASQKNGNGSKALTLATGQPLPTVEEHLKRIFEALAAGPAEREAKELMAKAAAEVVFAHWARAFDRRRALLDRERERRIRQRLTENDGNVSELLYAIDAAARDDWTRGRAPNSVKPYDDVHTVLRDRAQVEKFANRCPGYKRDETHPVILQLQAENNVQGLN